MTVVTKCATRREPPCVAEVKRAQTPLAHYTELPHLVNLTAGIEAVWVSISQHKHSYRVLPDGRCDLILRFRIKQKQISALSIIVTGPTSNFYDIPLEAGMGFVGIRLRPGYFETILGLEPIRLRGRDLQGDAAMDACPDLKVLCLPAANPDELVDRLVGFVRKRHAESDFAMAAQNRNIISALHAAGGRLRVAEIAAMHGICERTVRRIVLRATGLPPKVLASIIQFHRALRLLRDHHLSLADAALEAGFADQAHMNRVFRRMGGFSPARLPDVTLVTISD